MCALQNAFGAFKLCGGGKSGYYRQWLAYAVAVVGLLYLRVELTPAVLGGGKVIMVSNQIASDIELFFNWGAASAGGVVLLVLTLALMGLATRLLRLDLRGPHG